MAKLTPTQLETLEVVNQMKFPIAGGNYGGEGLGNIIKDSFDHSPLKVWEGSADPTIPPGITGSAIADLYLRDAPGPDGGELWIKTGDADTSWSKVSTSAAMLLASDHILVGNAGGIATDVAMSGEASILASGVVTLQNSAVIAKMLAGYVKGAGVVSASDSLLQAIQKLDGNADSKLNAALGNAHIFVGDLSDVAVDVAMSGEALISNLGAITLSNAAVIGKVLTGYVKGAGAVSVLDSIFTAIQKLDGNDDAKVEGPASSTDHAIARFDLATGKLIQNSMLLLDDAGSLVSQVANGAAAVAFNFQTQAFSTDGAKFCQVLNDTIPVCEVKRDTSLLWGDKPGQNIFNEYTQEGNLAIQRAIYEDHTNPTPTRRLQEFSIADWRQEKSLHVGNSADLGGTSWIQSFFSAPGEQSDYYIWGLNSNLSRVVFQSAMSATAADWYLAAQGVSVTTKAAYKLSGFDFSAFSALKTNMRHHWSKDTNYRYGFGLDTANRLVGVSYPTSTWTFESAVADGAAAIGFEYNTLRDLANVTAKVASWKRANNELMSLSRAGNLGVVGEFSMKVYAQDAAPTLTADNFMAIWKDTDDSNRVYLMFRRGTGDQVKIELTA